MSIPIAQISDANNTAASIIGSSSSNSSSNQASSILNTFITYLKNNYVTIGLVFAVLWMSRRVDPYVIVNKMPSFVFPLGNGNILAVVYTLLFIVAEFVLKTFVLK